MKSLRYLWTTITRGTEIAEREKLFDAALRACGHSYPVLIDNHDAEALAMKVLMHQACTECANDWSSLKKDEVFHDRNHELTIDLARAIT